VFNHSLDLMILSAIMTARLWMRLTQEHLSRAVLVPIAVMLAMIASYPILVEASEGGITRTPAGRHRFPRPSRRAR
jgi:BarA-like signal transduction histidine kinase